MFGLFTPKCPLETQEKVWVERRMLWLAERFGIDRLRTAKVVLPTNEFFPAELAGNEAGARKCFELICGHMGIDPESVSLQFAADDDMPGAAGRYYIGEKSTIWVAASQLDAPPRLLATIIHELSHELLLKGEHLTTEIADHEQVTDLLPVFLGLGIPLANATVFTASASDGNMSYYWSSRQGYLSSITLGYALALFAYARGEEKPKWIHHLRKDAADTTKTGLRFLRKTGDSLFRPDTAGRPRIAPTVADITQRLQHESPTVRLDSLRDLNEYSLYLDHLLPEVERCIGDRDPSVKYEAIRTVGSFGPLANKAIPLLIEAAWYGQTDVRVAAATALGNINGDPEVIIAPLAAIINDDVPDVAIAAANSLKRYGRRAEAAEAKLLQALETAGARGDTNRLPHLAATLLAISVNARLALKPIGQRDLEILRFILGFIREQEGG